MNEREFKCGLLTSRNELWTFKDYVELSEGGLVYFCYATPRVSVCADADDEGMGGLRLFCVSKLIHLIRFPFSFTQRQPGSRRL